MLLPQLPQQTYKKLKKQAVNLSKMLPANLSPLKPEAAKASKPAVATERVLTDYEVLIIGAGVSGVDMACHLQQRYETRSASPKTNLPGKRFLIVDKRGDIGGTWDLFKYPGIRSDSDMFTFGFAHRPWLSKKTLTDGESIKAYIKQTAHDEQIDSAIRFHTEVTQLTWSSKNKYWSATLYNCQTKQSQTVTARFVIGATGYYDFEEGYQPHFAGQEDFAGQLIHPQQWPENLDYHDKKVVVIGSGATAVTLVPALVDPQADKRAAHVTMLQRSPTYIASVPSVDDGVRVLTQYLPLNTQQAYTLMRWKNVLTQQAIYQFSKHAPSTMKTILTNKAKQDLKGSGVALSHFTPDYNPWDERLCAVPDGDLFQALHGERAEIITDEIVRLTPTGIELKSGKQLEADIIVTATGLKLQMLGGAQVTIDKQSVPVSERMTYKAVLVEDVPNMAVLFGYTNASWTLKIDLACAYVLRLLQYMDEHGYQTVVPQSHLETGEQVVRQEDTVMGSLSAGYIQRAKDVLPKQGDRYPWKVTNNYLTDRVMLKYSPIDDDWLKFSN
ncbi:MAG: NAD(P)/FAD-dependent oxidoreductase [Psychrobacter sp.]|nr:NAD(P)/FAD-dependent oxidoreductase [Psychrobacter sp.]